MRRENTGQILLISVAIMVLYIYIAAYQLLTGMAMPTTLVSIENDVLYNYQVQRKLSDVLSSLTQEAADLANCWCGAHFELMSRKREVVLPYGKPFIYQGFIASDWTMNKFSGIISPREEKTFRNGSIKILNLRLYGTSLPLIDVSSSNFSYVFSQDVLDLRIMAYSGQPKMLKVTLTVVAFEALVDVIELRLYANGSYEALCYRGPCAISYDDEPVIEHKTFYFGESDASKILLIVALHELGSHGGWYSLDLEDGLYYGAKKLTEYKINRDFTLITDGVIHVKFLSELVDYELLQLKRSTIVIKNSKSQVKLPPGNYSLRYNSFTGSLSICNASINLDAVSYTHLTLPTTERV